MGLPHQIAIINHTCNSRQGGRKRPPCFFRRSAYEPRDPALRRSSPSAVCRPDRRVYFHRGVRYEEEGFSVQPHVYYRPAVDNLELSMKPHRYELDLRATEQDAALLRDYLRQSCIPGEQVELWNLWVSDIRVRAFRLTGPLADLDADALVQMEEREQTCITLTI